METIIVLVLISAAIWYFQKRARTPSHNEPADLSALPPRFVVYDLETTGLDPERHEIIEIGAIRVNRDSENHETFQTFVIPTGRISSRITEITGIDRKMVQAEGHSLAEALSHFREFVAFNASFDNAFIAAACRRTEIAPFANETCCALKMARRAWPEKRSYKLTELAREGNLSLNGEHRALGDCQRTMIVYAAAATHLGTYR
jgi:DNA polymerase III alpha subunit (gram-positive type)